MSIATEIARLQTAKADIKTAIEAKGVTVPSSAKLDDYDTYVGQISSGATLQSKSVTPTTSQQTVSPDQGYDGLSSVTVDAVTAAIDANIQPGNILQGVDILGVTGTVQPYVAPVIAPLPATPSTSPQTITAPVGTDGYNPVSVSAVDASIDANIQPQNIKKDVSILGVVGTMEPMPPTPQGAIYEVRLGDGTTQRVYTADQSTTINSSSSHLANSSVMYESDYITTIGSQAFYTRNLCQEIVTPNCTTITGGSNFRSTAITRIHVGTLTTFANPFWSGINTNLRLFEVGQGTAVNLPCGGWTATNVIAEGQTGIDELNYNIKTYLADKVADRTGLAALTVTFGASLYNVLTAATIAAFTAKNWNVASA